MADFYKKGIDFQRKRTGMTTLGFSTPATYPVTSKVYTMSADTGVDLYNPVKIEGFLVHQVAAKSAVQNQVNPTSFGMFN